MSLKTGALIFALLASALISLGLFSGSFAYNTNMSASVVLGQSNFSSSNAVLNANGFSSPIGLTSDGTRLAVADYSYNRVLIFNNIPTKNNVPADVVVGQANFTSGSANQGGSAAANTLRNPSDVRIAGNKLIVSDTGNNRILVFDNIPTANNGSANVVIGQTNLTDSSEGISSAKVSAPSGIDYDPVSGKLVIVDETNNRVLIYNSIPTVNGAAADVVVGQSGFTTSTSGTSATRLDNPRCARVIEGKLVVCDRLNNRILIWNSLPTTNGVAADVVVGQANFTSGSANQGGNAAANTLSQPYDLAGDGKRLFIKDRGNVRILVFGGVPTANNASAFEVIGQNDFTSTSANQGGDIAANNLGSNLDLGIVAVSNQLIVSDPLDVRVLIYDDVSNKPGLTLNNFPEGRPFGRLRFRGRVTVGGNYTVRSVDANVNGQGGGSTTPTDGQFGSNNEEFYFDFDPKSNGAKEGYTIRLSSQNSNLEVVDNLFYFTPFDVVDPPKGSKTANNLPTLTFKVGRERFRDLKENLSKFQIAVKGERGGWRIYADEIPVDFEAVKNSNDNLRKNNLSKRGNGIYETKRIKVTYFNDNSQIAVSAKNVNNLGLATDKYIDDGGKKLSDGTYLWKATAVDKGGHSLETEQAFTLTVDSSLPQSTQTLDSVLGGSAEASVAASTDQPAPGESDDKQANGGQAFGEKGRIQALYAILVVAGVLASVIFLKVFVRRNQV